MALRRQATQNETELAANARDMVERLQAAYWSKPKDELNNLAPTTEVQRWFDDALNKRDPRPSAPPAQTSLANSSA